MRYLALLVCLAFLLAACLADSVHVLLVCYATDTVNLADSVFVCADSIPALP